MSKHEVTSLLNMIDINDIHQTADVHPEWTNNCKLIIASIWLFNVEHITNCLMHALEGIIFPNCLLNIFWECNLFNDIQKQTSNKRASWIIKYRHNITLSYSC